jgi:hypothetical protein
MFQNNSVTEDTFERAEILLEELRGESPLKHRLTMELEELRKIHAKTLSASS